MRPTMTTAQVSRMLIDELGYGEVSDVGECGAGAWSTAYRFVAGSDECVVRIGSHEADFRADQAMAPKRATCCPFRRCTQLVSCPTEAGSSIAYQRSYPGPRWSRVRPRVGRRSLIRSPMLSRRCGW